MGKPATKSTEKGRDGRPAMPGRINQVTFAPSILASDFAHLGREVNKCKRARCPWIHVDVMDNHFVPNLTLGPPILEKVIRAVPGLFYDAHLMVENPRRLARDFVRAGASMVTTHLEAEDDPAAMCRYLRRQKVRVGVSIKPKTPVRLLEPVLPLVDLVLIMTVEPGFGGQDLLGRSLNKIRELKRLRDEKGLAFLIQADGGINESTLRLVSTAGAEVLVMGTAIFRDGQVLENVKRLRERLQNPPARG